jgi:uncharacterized metal-binding protein YceD (DUF177 family)
MLADHIGIPQLRDLASRSEQVSNSIRVHDMPRLAGLLHPDIESADKEINARIEFLGGKQGASKGNAQGNSPGFPEISGHLKGSLNIFCQRCLGPLAWSVDIKFRLTVIASTADFDEVAEPFDALVAGEHGIRLIEIIEDELIGSLPLAPMHKDIADCETAIGVEFIDNDIESSLSASDSDTNRPFEDLAALLNAGNAPNGSKETD